MEWVETAVASWEDWAPGLRTLRLERSASFRAGQFLNLALDPEGRLNRSYSMASAPDAPLEFYLVEVPGGALSPRLLELTPGSPVWVSDTPAGHFTLERVPDAEVLWLVATGTGLGPYLSMLATPEPFARFGRVVVVHAARERAHLAYRERLAALGRERPLSWVGVVSREAPGPGALDGRIPARIADGSLEAAAGAAFDPATSQVLLCGNPAFVRDATAALGERGLTKHRRRAPGQVTSERYWQLPRTAR